MISLQLRGHRQIAEPRKYCLVCVIVFLWRVFSLIFLFLTGWEFGLIPYKKKLRTGDMDMDTGAGDLDMDMDKATGDLDIDTATGDMDKGMAIGDKDTKAYPDTMVLVGKWILAY